VSLGISNLNIVEDQLSLKCLPFSRLSDQVYVTIQDLKPYYFILQDNNPKTTKTYNVLETRCLEIIMIMILNLYSALIYVDIF
jgi:hypothetical protein